jgi:hypothetical protein
MEGTASLGGRLDVLENIKISFPCRAGTDLKSTTTEKRLCVTQKCISKIFVGTSAGGQINKLQGLSQPYQANS